MSSSSFHLSDTIRLAVTALKIGGVIAYPTEYCFGLGCDPMNEPAIQRLLKIKKRQPEQGVILIASSIKQVEAYVDLQSSPILNDILASWPGPSTWVLPARPHVSNWVKGKHSGVAVRVTDNMVSKELCVHYGGALVSTSANRHGESALLTAEAVSNEMGAELSYVLNQLVGGAKTASTIRDGMTGKQLR